MFLRTSHSFFLQNKTTCAHQTYTPHGGRNTATHRQKRERHPFSSGSTKKEQHFHDSREVNLGKTSHAHRCWKRFLSSGVYAGVFAFLYGSERALRNRVLSTPPGRVNNRPLESLPKSVRCHSRGKARPLCDGKRALWARGDAENR